MEKNGGLCEHGDVSSSSVKAEEYFISCITSDNWQIRYYIHP